MGVRLNRTAVIDRGKGNDTMDGVERVRHLDGVERHSGTLLVRWAGGGEFNHACCGFHGSLPVSTGPAKRLRESGSLARVHFNKERPRRSAP